MDVCLFRWHADEHKFTLINAIKIQYKNSRWRLIDNHTVSLFHYDDVIMTTIVSQITSLTSVNSTVYSDADQNKHQSSASLAFVWGIHRDRWIPRTKGQLRGKCFHLMTSSWFHFFHLRVFALNWYGIFTHFLRDCFFGTMIVRLVHYQ